MQFGSGVLSKSVIIIHVLRVQLHRHGFSISTLKVRTCYDLSFDVFHKLPLVSLLQKIWSVLKEKTDQKKSKQKIFNIL